MNFTITIKRIIILTIVLSLFTVNACKKSDKKSIGLQGSIEVAGSSTVFPITTAMAEEFVKLNLGVDIPIRSTGTGGGFSNFFATGKTDINNASRHIKDEERTAARKLGIEAIEFQVAIDAITIVINNNNPVNNITSKELQTIWHPNTAANNWNKVNATWPNIPFELYGPSSASGTFDYFTDVIIGEEGLSRADYQKTEQDNTIIQAIQGSTGALGYLGFAYYLGNKNTIKALLVNGVSPSLGNSKKGKYTPLSRPIFIYVSSKSLERPEVQAFIRFYIELTSTELISEVGYIPLSSEIQTENLKKLDDIIAKKEISH